MRLHKKSQAGPVQGMAVVGDGQTINPAIKKCCVQHTSLILHETRRGTVVLLQDVRVAHFPSTSADADFQLKKDVSDHTFLISNCLLLTPLQTLQFLKNIGC